jgi:DNA-binding beta-propeller fold protein YncE
MSVARIEPVIGVFPLSSYNPASARNSNSGANKNDPCRSSIPGITCCKEVQARNAGHGVSFDRHGRYLDAIVEGSGPIEQLAWLLERICLYETNGTNNSILVFNRTANGSLSLAATVSTRGLGGGVVPVGSQGTLALSQDGRWLFAANEGDNTISVLERTPAGLKLAGRVSSNGTLPVSITVSRNLVYVLNDGRPRAHQTHSRQTLPGSTSITIAAGSTPFRLPPAR